VHDGDIQQEEVLAPDEAPTPMWLPLLGVALLLFAGLFVATRGGDEPAAEGAEQPATEPAAAPAQAAEEAAPDPHPEH
jgi:hypothetical protein